MAFLRTLFWIVLTIIVVIFTVHNWKPVEIDLFGNLVWETKLPVPMLLAFLVGWAPLYAWHRAIRWSEARRRAAAERALAVAAVAVGGETPAAVMVEPASVGPAEDGTAPARAD